MTLSSVLGCQVFSALEKQNVPKDKVFFVAKCTSAKFKLITCKLYIFFPLQYLHAYLKCESMGITGMHAIPMMITCMLQGTLCDKGIPCTFYGYF